MGLYRRFLLSASLALTVAISCGAVARSATPLTTIRNPAGGEIVYGHVDGATNEASAMGIILRSIHSECGNKPSVGKVFRVRGTGSDAVFFTVVKRTQGNKPVAGLIIASQSASGDVEAALVTDDAARFGTSVNPMLKTLFGAWHPAGGPTGRGSSHHAPPASDVPEMTKVSADDDSASVSLPPGWKLNAGRYGTLFAGGPNGERAALGSGLVAFDSNNPRVARTEAFAQGAGRNTSYARAMYYPHGADPATTFVAVVQRIRENAGAPAADITVAQAAELAAPAPWHCARITGSVDAKDNVGSREFDAVFCQGPESRMGQFMNVVSMVSIPEKFADRERATAAAILASFSTNSAVVGGEASQMAAPEIAKIHAIGQRAAQQAASAHAMEDAHNASVESHWDAEDKSGQAFSNYLLDQTVISDNQNNAHATVWNSTADAMVKSNPDRYQYVDTPNFWKGVDY